MDIFSLKDGSIIKVDWTNTKQILSIPKDKMIEIKQQLDEVQSILLKTKLDNITISEITPDILKHLYENIK